MKPVQEHRDFPEIQVTPKQAEDQDSPAGENDHQIQMIQADQIIVH